MSQGAPPYRESAVCKGGRGEGPVYTCQSRFSGSLCDGGRGWGRCQGGGKGGAAFGVRGQVRGDAGWGNEVAGVRGHVQRQLQ